MSHDEDNMTDGILELDVHDFIRFRMPHWFRGMEHEGSEDNGETIVKNEEVFAMVQAIPTMSSKARNSTTQRKRRRKPCRRRHSKTMFAVLEKIVRPPGFGTTELMLGFAHIPIIPTTERRSHL
jgi:hypothetical protein